MIASVAMTSAEEIQETAAKICAEAVVPGYRDFVYVLPSEKRARVNVSAQQRRSLNLVWALYVRGHLKSDTNVWVIGAGAGGLTCAAALAALKVKVSVFDRFPIPMHFQLGCHHRFLHPRMVEWPSEKSTMASANLPILDWSVGTAHEVRSRILDDYHAIMERNEQQPAPIVVSNLQVLPNGDAWFTRKGSSEEETTAVPRGSKPSLIVLALGFGVETTINSLPARSYWRLDPLDQTSLDTTDPVRSVLVCGGGDGGVTDFLRAALTSFDHGPFIDHACMLLDAPRSAIQKIEDEADAMRDDVSKALGDSKPASSRAADVLSAFLGRRYGELEQHFGRLDAFLKGQLRLGVRVDWSGAGLAPHGMVYRTQPLHRLLAWRLLKVAPDRVRYRQESVTRVVHLDHERPSGERYEVSVCSPSNGAAPSSESKSEVMRYHDVVVRYGTTPALAQSFPAIDLAIKQRKVPREHNDTLVPWAFDLFWEKGRRPKADKEQDGLRAEVVNPEVDAVPTREIVEGAGVPPEKLTGLESLRCVKVRVFVDPGVAANHGSASWLTYILHPDDDPVARRASRGFQEKGAENVQPFALTLFTYDDYVISGTLSDGTRLQPKLLSQLLPKDQTESLVVGKDLLAKGSTYEPVLKKLLRRRAHVLKAEAGEEEERSRLAAALKSGKISILL